MRTKRLADTDVEIPEIGLGTWNYRAGPGPLIAGLDAGARFIDTAESYETETVVGEALRGRREQVFVATKISPANFRRRDVVLSAEKSLHRLQTDHIDLYQLHAPSDEVPLEETLGAMEELVEAGKVRFIGVSNFSVEQLQQAQRAMRKHRIAANQVRFSLIDRTISADLLPYCQAQAVTVIAYSPLARGFQHILDCDQHGVLAKIAASTGRTPVQVALNWCTAQRGVVAIPKGNSTTHVLEACGASGWRLSPDQVAELDQGIRFRRRSRLEMFARRNLPSFCHRAIHYLAKHSPAALRRRLY